MLKRIYPSVYCWSEIHGEARNQPYYWNSYLIHIREKNVLALVDPLPLSTDEVREVEELGMPTHILLTCNFHLRESESYRQKWGCKIFINEIGLKEAEIPIDGTFKPGDLILDSIEAIRISDVSWPEEIVFLVRQDKGILIIGDALCGGRADIGISDSEVGIYPPTLWKFRPPIVDIQKTRNSISRLMEYPFDSICFGHGSPILYQAKAALQRFIDRIYQLPYQRW